MTYCKINGTSFDVTVAMSALEESFSVLDGENAGRVMTGTMVRDIIGTYIQHKVTFFNGKSQSDFDALWDFLIEHSVDDYVNVQMADGQTSIAYKAYYTSGTRKLKHSDGETNSWDEIEVTFIPIEAQVKPT